MKKRYTVIAVAALLLLLAGCGKQNDTKTDTTGTDITATTTGTTNPETTSPDATISETTTPDTTTPATTGSTPSASADPGATTTPEEPSKANDPENMSDIAGPWELRPDNNDFTAMRELFGTSFSYGNSMEIKSDGSISYYAGAYERTGTYTREGDKLIAKVKDAINNTEETAELTVSELEGELCIAMEYQGTELIWTQQ